MPLTAYQLRFCPARYIHESHLPAVLLRLLPALPDWRRQSVLNAWLLEQLELDCAFRMPAQLGGLALYPQAALERTLGWLGALLHGQALRQVLDGARVRRIRAQIGEQGQRFCLEQARPAHRSLAARLAAGLAGKPGRRLFPALRPGFLAGRL